MRTLINKEIRDKTEQVIEDYCFKCHPKSHDKSADHEKECITARQFDEWKDRFEDEAFMVRDCENMEKLDADMFIRGRI